MKPSAEFAYRVLQAHPEGLTRAEAIDKGIGNMPARVLEFKQAGLPVADRWVRTRAGAQIKRWFIPAPTTAAPLSGVQSSLFDSSLTAAPPPSAAVNRAPTGARQ